MKHPHSRPIHTDIVEVDDEIGFAIVGLANNELLRRRNKNKSTVWEHAPLFLAKTTRQ